MATTQIDQPDGWYVSEARAELPTDAPWPRIAKRAWQLQRAAEREEDQRIRQVTR